MNSKLNGLNYDPFLICLLVNGVVFCGFYIAYELGLLSTILASDVTHISTLILFVLVMILAHCTWRSWVIAQQVNFFKDFVEQGQTDLKPVSLSPISLSSVDLSYVGINWPQDFLQLSKSTKPESGQHDLRAQVLAERLRGPNQIGWFCAGLMIKFGLLGTVIGFAIMLSSVNSLEALEITDVKNLMQQMTQGMRVAMNTTIIGLISSIALGVQYLLLDRFADGLVASVIDHLDMSGEH